MLLFSKIKEKIFYGWVIVAASLVIAVILSGTRFSFGVFFKPLADEFDLTRAATSSLFSASMLFAAIFAVISGWALDKYGPRLVIFLMGLLTGSSLLLASQAGSLWQLFLSYSLLLSIGTGATYSVLMTIVSRWFDEKRGLVLGIAGSGSGFGTILMVPFAAYLVSNLGWRISYIVMGLIAWLVVISASRLLRNNPSEIGVLSDGAKIKTASAKVEVQEESPQSNGLSLPQVVRTRNFWLFLSVWLLSSFCSNLVTTHIVPHATDIGISTVTAATIVSFMGGFNIISRLLTGRISDIIGRKIPFIISALLRAGAVAGLIWARELWMFYLFAIIFGLAWGGVGVTSTTLITDTFRGRNLGTIMGIINTAHLVGAALGPFVGGLVFDVHNNYSLAFAIGTVAILMTGVLVAFVKQATND